MLRHVSDQLQMQQTMKTTAGRDADMTLDDLILARLLAAGRTHSLTVNRLQQNLEPFHPVAAGTAARRSALADAIGSLQRAGAIEALGSRTVRLTDQGRQRAVAAFDLTAARESPGWQTLVAVDLIVRALGLARPEAAERRRLTSASGLRAAVLRQAYQLPLTIYPTLSQARDALLWHCLSRLPAQPALAQGFNERIGKPFTIKAVAGQLLSNLANTGQVLQPAAALAQLAAAGVGARGTGIAELRHAIIRRALRNPAAQPVETADTLAAFADRVREVARHCETGHFGPGKMFISHVSARYRERYPVLDAAEFKHRLLLAHRRGLLRLARADLLQAMDPADIRESEIEDRGDRLHFLRLEN